MARYNFVFVMVKQFNSDRVIHANYRVQRGHLAKQISFFSSTISVDCLALNDTVEIQNADTLNLLFKYSVGFNM